MNKFLIISGILSVVFGGQIALANGDIWLDVRTPDEYKTEHVNNSVNVDFYNSQFDSQLSKLDKDANYKVYCRSGNRSGQTVKK
jgi:rhodanese-related sulfurtransferase